MLLKVQLISPDGASQISFLENVQAPFYNAGEIRISEAGKSYGKSFFSEKRVTELLRQEREEINFYKDENNFLKKKFIELEKTNALFD